MRMSVKATAQEIADRDGDLIDTRKGHMWAIVTSAGNIMDFGELSGTRVVMMKRCRAWNGKHPNKPRWVRKIDMWWGIPRPTRRSL